jgi:polyphosphate kinase
MDYNYQYFKRDISWLSFNYRVLLEAADSKLPLYERINFISIYSSNLEEFYKIRVADHKAIASGSARNDEETVQSVGRLLEEINDEVNRQLEIRVAIYEDKIIPAMRRNHIIFYQNSNVEPQHREFVSNFFREEIFPYLQPVPVDKQRVISFLRDNRLYLAVRLLRNGTRREDPNHIQYFVLKLPYSKVPRFIELPKLGDNYYIMFIEDIIKANIWQMFPGYTVDCSYCIKTSRDADIMIEDSASTADLMEQLKKKVKKRKIGAVCRFVYERAIPHDFLEFLCDAFNIDREELVPGDKHLNLEDLRLLPCPLKGSKYQPEKPRPMHLNCLDNQDSIFNYVEKRDLMLYYPYHSFDHFIHFLYEAVHDPKTREIMVTQYRVAENSVVINTLIAAAQNKKKVTVFVELKARFDEENNLATAQMMQAAGIKIIYSLPGLKVHAKVALVRRHDDDGKQCDIAYIGTGNFNEKTATQYADCGLFTCNHRITHDLHTLFQTLQGKECPKFTTLLVARFNLMDELNRLIDNEIELARNGKEGHIILKMNALQDQAMIDRLYEASTAGVKIELIVRGICCLIPGQPYSKNITITRIVDTFLEHARVWYFGNNGKPKLYCGSPDWMKRNLYRRIEAVTPVLDCDIKRDLIEMLRIQLNDNQKGCYVDKNQNNVFKHKGKGEEAIRSQYTFYDYLKRKNDDYQVNPGM